MCDRKRVKGVAIGGWGEGCDKRVLVEEILKYCVNKEDPAEIFDLKLRDGYSYLKS